MAMPVALAILLAGCSGAMEGFSFGKAPKEAPADPTLYPKDYRPEIAAFMRRYLENPTQVRDASIAEPVMRPVGSTQQYITCVRYNPRDGSNRYQGTTTRVALFLSGRLNQFIPDDQKLCDGLNYQRYPEIESLTP